MPSSTRSICPAGQRCMSARGDRHHGAHGWLDAQGGGSERKGSSPGRPGSNRAVERFGGCAIARCSVQTTGQHNKRCPLLSGSLRAVRSASNAGAHLILFGFLTGRIFGKEISTGRPGLAAASAASSQGPLPRSRSTRLMASSPSSMETRSDLLSKEMVP